MLALKIGVGAGDKHPGGVGDKDALAGAGSHGGERHAQFGRADVTLVCIGFRNGAQLLGGVSDLLAGFGQEDPAAGKAKGHADHQKADEDHQHADLAG